MTIGERIAIIRDKKGLNQEAFGKIINVTRSAISNYEKGTRNIMDRVIIDICREFNVNEEWLRNETGEMFIQTPNDELTQLAQKYNFNDLEYKFLYEYLKLDLDKRGAIVEFLENIVNSDSSLLATEEKNLDKPNSSIDIQIKNSNDTDTDLEIKQELANYERELKASLGKKMSLVSGKKRNA